MSIFPRTVRGNLSICKKNLGIIYLGKLTLKNFFNLPTSIFLLAIKYAYILSLFTVTAECNILGYFFITFSISSISILKPFNFICESSLPKYCKSPLNSNLDKSPVLYTS